MPRRGEPTERTCIVTRVAAPVDALIRFVRAPDGEVVPDVKRRLPGRGVWVTARAEHVRTAEKRRLFQRGFGEPVTVAPGLDRRVADQLAMAALGALSLARKAGAVVAGFAKVEAAIAAGNVAGLIEAEGAGADGTAKLKAALKRRAGDAAAIPVIGLFTGEQLDLAFGRSNVIHAALLVGPASANVLKRVQYLADYLGEAERVDGTSRFSTLPSEASAGP
jgi:predicted RNA-binding protein YlxR (DUF448 family)